LPREPGSRRPAFEGRPSDAAGWARSGTCPSRPPASASLVGRHRQRRPAAGRLPRQNVLKPCRLLRCPQRRGLPKRARRTLRTWWAAHQQTRLAGRSVETPQL